MTANQQTTARVAAIGVGYWGKNLVRNFAELGSLAALADPDRDAAAAQALASPWPCIDIGARAGKTLHPPTEFVIRPAIEIAAGEQATQRPVIEYLRARGIDCNCGVVVVERLVDALLQEGGQQILRPGPAARENLRHPQHERRAEDAVTDRGHGLAVP